MEIFAGLTVAVAPVIGVPLVAAWLGGVRVEGVRVARKDRRAASEREFVAA